ncbi:glycosyltransferase family 4 protein [Vulcanisaeta thermophila]|uniref:glycosyltransferase family 4 protein n=1 Tax=Vulcanisaeta thermophila TaxID=867917 RepID=UPI0008539BDF|nr:glycosyltransferase family 4 protein [Vulcanisaeta thermophila]
MVRPRLLVFTELYLPEGSGGELATHLFLSFLSKYFDVTVVTGTSRPAPEVYRFGRVVVVPWFKDLKPMVWLKLLINARWFKRLVRDSQVVYVPSHKLLPITTVVKHINKDARVVVHLHNYQLISYTSIYINGLKPSLITDALVEYLENGSLLRALATGLISWSNIMNSAALRYADEVICVSKAQLKILGRFIPSIGRKATVIYNPLPPIPSIEKKPEETPSMIYAGGGSYVKGFHILLEALPRILKNNLRIYITAGRRIPQKSLKALKYVEKLYPSPSRVFLLGRLERRQYLNLHEKAWALLFPSIWEEPLPYAVMESMALGTIPIASRVGGVPEIVGGSPAEEYMFMPGDVEGFVDRVDRVLTLTRGELEDIGGKLREHVVRRFDQRKIERAFLNLIYKVLSS